jgi:hypothetical protein
LSAIDDELSIMNKRSIFVTLFSFVGVNVYVGGTAASVARQVPPDVPCELQASAHGASKARSREVRLFNPFPCRAPCSTRSTLLT